MRSRVTPNSFPTSSSVRRPAVFQTKTKLQHFTFALGQRRQHILDLLLEQLVGRGFLRRHGAGIFNEVAEVAIFLLANRRLSETGSCETLMISRTFSEA